MDTSDMARYAAGVRHLFDSILEIESDERQRELIRCCADDSELRRQLDALLVTAAAMGDAGDTPDSRLNEREVWNRLAASLEQLRSASADEREDLCTNIFGTHESVRSAIDHLLAMEERHPGYLDVLLNEPAADLEPVPDPMIGRLISHYRIVEFLGGGGMGVVYRARDLRLDRDVAMKFLPPLLHTETAAMRRFVREAKAASALDHPNIGSVYEIDEMEGRRPFIVMACYRGETLQARISRGPLDVEEARDIAIQIASGLAAAHDRGVVHRDVKPGNVIITEGGRIKLIDFGLAKSRELPDVTKSGSTIGTLAYMSPEQVRGEAVDARTDVWSSGVVLYEMLSRRRPFEGDYDQAVQYSILHETPASLKGIRADIPADLEHAVAKAMQKKPQMRYQSAKEMLHDLRPGLPVDGGVLAKRSYRRWATAAAVLVISILIAAAVYAVSFVAVPLPESNQRKMMAVLPFRNLGSEADVYFADGITEEITSRLARISGLGVISSSSAMQYRDTDKSTREIGEELGVEYLLAGSIQWQRSSGSADRVRVIPRLIQVSDDRQIWSETYDRDLVDILAVQAALSEDVIQELDVTLSEPESDALSLIPTDNHDAYQAYLAGFHYESNKNDQMAVEMFEQAVRLDSSFVQPHTFLVSIHLRNYNYYRDEGRLAKANEALDRAVHLNPDHPEVVLARAYHDLYVTADYDRAIATLERAGRLLPNDPRPLESAAFVYWRRGEYEPAIMKLEQAAKVDPRSYTHAMNLAWVHSVMREYEASERWCTVALGLKADDTHGYAFRAILSLLRGDTVRARALLTSAPTPSFVPDIVFANYFLNLAEGEYAVAAAWLDSTDVDEIGVRHFTFPKSWLRGYVHQLLGEESLSRDGYREAAEQMQRKTRESPDNFKYHSALGLAYAGLGLREEAVHEGKWAADLVPMSRDALTGTIPRMHLAHINALVGDHDAAISELDYLLSIPSWMTAEWIRLDPRWDVLRNDPRFERMLARHG